MTKKQGITAFNWIIVFSILAATLTKGLIVVGVIAGLVFAAMVAAKVVK
jgi:hypothetical protein